MDVKKCGRKKEITRRKYKSDTQVTVKSSIKVNFKCRTAFSA